MTATPIDIAERLAAIWGSQPTPKPLAVVAPILPPLPELLRCAFDHDNSANWNYGPDRYGRKGWRRVTCKGCGAFYGYAPPRATKKRKSAKENT